MKKFYTITLLFLTGFTTLFAQIPTNGLIAWYPFNNNAQDSSGNAYNGVINGPTSTLDRFNYPNKAFLFNGNAQSVSVDNNVYSASLTLSAWIYVNDFGSLSPDVSGKMIIFKAPNTGTSNDYSLGVGYINSQAKATFSFGQNSTQYVSLVSSSVLNKNEWYLLTATRENGVAKLYINSNLDASKNYSFTPTNQNYNLKIGISHVDFQSFNGRLDDIRIFNRALTLNEITSIHTATDETTSLDDNVINNPKTIANIYNIQGQEVNKYYSGLVIYRYTDGTSEKVVQE